MVKTAVLVSGGGSNLQSVLDAMVFGELPDCELTAVISTSPEAYALRRARMSGVPGYVVDRELFPSSTVFGFALLDKLRDLDIDLVVLAGYGCELTHPLLKHYSGRLIDTYPSLMPAFTEPPMTGEEVCTLTLQRGVKLTGATAYLITEAPGSGPIIAQKAVEVREDDTPATLRRRVLEEGENHVLPLALRLYCGGLLKIEDGVARILETAKKDALNRA